MNHIEQMKFLPFQNLTLDLLVYIHSNPKSKSKYLLWLTFPCKHVLYSIGTAIKSFSLNSYPFFIIYFNSLPKKPWSLIGLCENFTVFLLQLSHQVQVH